MRAADSRQAYTERCLEAVFRFLLGRERKESILARFDATVISRYFPEFEREVSRYLSRPNGIVHALCFASSPRFAGLPEECWIPVNYPSTLRRAKLLMNTRLACK